MYDTYYHLSEEPFRLSSDFRFCYGHQSFSRARAYMQYAFERAEGFVMITGQPGTGKTTLVNDLVHSLESTSSVKIAMLITTQMDASDLLRMVAYSFGIKEEISNKAVLLQRMSEMLISNHRNGGRALLIIDEAQGLTVSALEELRLLTNVQLNSVPLIQIFLLGQEGLKDLIHSPEMEQVHQRLVATCFLKPLLESETKAYIKHRLEIAGWKNNPAISEAVYPIIFKYSQGIPRRINLICSRLFLYGSLEELDKIGVNAAELVIAELRSEQLLPVGISPGKEFEALDVYEAQDKVAEVASEPKPKPKPEPEPEPEQQPEPDLSDDSGYQPVVEYSSIELPVYESPSSESPVTIDTEYPSRNASFVGVADYDEIGKATAVHDSEGRLGIYVVSLGAALLAIVIALYLVNPAAFTQQVIKAKSWIGQSLGQENADMRDDVAGHVLKV
ncbi:ExeA family protein [Neptunomonas sp.]|uniref:ExeA family protein n=1 Tax=Neptunomonas sp. TaxID=1971898 RepID=UPI003565005C